MTINLLFPASGQGRRFAELGINVPKPMIKIHDMTLMEIAIGSLVRAIAPGLAGHSNCYTILQHEDRAFDPMITSVERDDLHFITETGPLRGAANSVLFAINKMAEKDPGYLDRPIFVSNCDQLYSPGKPLDNVIMAVQSLVQGTTDSLTFVFSITQAERTGFHKWSYVVQDKDNDVSIVEKPKEWPIPGAVRVYPTIGVYGWHKTSVLKECIENMMKDDANKVNNEFYLAPCLNQSREVLKRLPKHGVLGMPVFMPLGTPEDVKEFLYNAWIADNIVIDEPQDKDQRGGV